MSSTTSEASGIERHPPLLIRIATRASPLARWQATWVADRLAALDPGVVCSLVLIETTADQHLEVPIWQMGGKGVFVKQIQAALLDGRADVAVHSAKDLPALTHPDLVLAAVPERADPRDALVGSSLAALAPGARIATGSPRRRAQLAWLRPDLTFAELRGNIATRLARLAEGNAEAIVMAAAALDRLELDPTTVVERLDPSVLLPQVGQGALALECRADDADQPVREMLARLEHPISRRLFDAERSFLVELGGDCDLPAGAHATLVDSGAQVRLEGLLASPDGHQLARHTVIAADGQAAGRAAALELRGAHPG